ncbi:MULTISPECIES: M56 family metallopeptidase [Bacillaceae]|uniref:M56 family metallopeptidase n=1 Tax=Bacillaceae TaxID=186817 RepID=UPI00104FC125|nr:MULTISPECIES: M56 family metallopeptidase [Bacillaceae]MDT2046268.1 M56 family metallopeptidase [Priestia flexa]TDB50046.1 hypothetical protein EPL02_13300 [Bacillus sp. CBEL-1]
MNKKQSLILFYASILVAISLLVQMTVYLIDPDHHLNVFTLCYHAVEHIGWKWAQYVLYGFVVYTLLLVFWKLTKQLWLLSQFHYQIKVSKVSNLTCYIDKHENIYQGVIVVKSPRPFALTKGFLKPQIVVSTNLVNLLNEKELEAVLYHEGFHARNKDPLKIFLLSLCASALWYLPVLRWSNERYKLISELLADRAAINSLDSPLPIGSALLKLIKYQREQASCAYAPFAETAVNYRIKCLVNPRMTITWNIPTFTMVKSVTVFVLLWSVFAY